MTDLVKSLGLAIGLALGFAVLIFLLRITMIRSHDQMRRFLDRRFDVIQKANSPSKRCHYIDKSMISRWGLYGFALIPLPAFGINQLGEINQLGDDFKLAFAIVMAASLVFPGMFFADSRAAIRFLQKIGVEQYNPESPHDSPN